MTELENGARLFAHHNFSSVEKHIKMLETSVFVYIKIWNVVWARGSFRVTENI
jgi:hypothetical protein